MVRSTVKREAVPYLISVANLLGFAGTAERLRALIAGDPAEVVTVELEAEFAETIKNDSYLFSRGYLEE